MNGKRLLLIAVLAIAVAAVLIVPVYAFNSSVSVNDNTVESTKRTIDIEDLTESFSVTPPEYENVSTPVWIRNQTFGIDADDDVKMRAWLYLNDPSDWLILDHAELRIYHVTTDQQVLADENVQKYILNVDTFEEVPQSTVDSTPGTYYVMAYDVDFGEEEISARQFQSFVPTSSMTLDPDIEYKFDLVFHFKGLVGETLYDQFASSFAGTITFAIADKDLLTPDA